MSWSLGGVDIGTVQGEPVDLDTGLIVITIPGLPSSNGIALSITGLTTTITISGSNTFASKTAAQKFLYSGAAGTGTMNLPASDSLLGIVGSAANAIDLQATPITYSSDFFSSVTGKIKTISHRMVLGSAYSYVNYDIEFLVIS